jgi:hypothetical protein
MSDDDTTATTGTVRALKRSMRDEFMGFVIVHVWQILSGIVGLIVGAMTVYLGILSQVANASQAAHDALTASTQVKESVAQLRADLGTLATERELTDTKDRVQNIEDRLNYATSQAGTPPVPRRRR